MNMDHLKEKIHIKNSPTNLGKQTGQSLFLSSSTSPLSCVVTFLVAFYFLYTLGPIVGIK